MTGYARVSNLQDPVLALAGAIRVVCGRAKVHPIDRRQYTGQPFRETAMTRTPIQYEYPPFTLRSNALFFHDWRYVHHGTTRWTTSTGGPIERYSDERFRT